MRKSLIRLAFTTALGAMLMQASPVFAKTPNDQLIVATSLAQVLSLDPHQATEAKANEIMANLYDRLISVDSSGKVSRSSPSAGRRTRRASPSICATRNLLPATR